LASDLILAAIEALSALSGVVLVYLTIKPCRASGVSYLLGIPAAFGLMTISFAARSVFLLVGPNSEATLLPRVVSLLTQTYGLLFLALTYARRMRLRFLGESTSIELAVPSVITVAILAYSLSYGLSSPGSVILDVDLSLRVVMALSALYLLYETTRSWGISRRAGEGVAVFGSTALFFEQLGFILVDQNFGSVAVFLAYEGRVLALFIFIVALTVALKKNDLVAPLKRLGLTAPAHEKSSGLQVDVSV
jgi:hypothetical protein